MKRTGKKLRVFTLLYAVFSLIPVQANAAPGKSTQFVLAAVQFCIEPEIYTSEEAFTAKLESVFSRITAQGKPDLVVFPEYTGVFLSLVPWLDRLQYAEDMEEGWAVLIRLRRKTADIRSFFVEESAATARRMDRIWGSLARKYGTAILAGSYFATETNADGYVELHNRGVVYGPAGTRLYEQDKVYLTPFETEVIGLQPAKVDEASWFIVKDRRIVFSICRDSFFEDWERQFRGADIWIDIKANGTEYDQQQAAGFMTALPERLESSNVPYGATVTLTGEFLDLFWEGESSVLEKKGEKLVFRKRAKTADGEDILVSRIEIPAR